MMIIVRNEYHVENFTYVELPKGKTLDDIKDIGFKWGRGSIVFKDGTRMDGIEQEETSGEYFKRPVGIKVTDEDFENEKVFEEE